MSSLRTGDMSDQFSLESDKFHLNFKVFCQILSFMVLLNIKEMSQSKGNCSPSLNEFPEACRVESVGGFDSLQNFIDYMPLTSPSVCEFPTPSISECSDSSDFSSTLEQSVIGNDSESEMDSALNLEKIYISDNFLHRDDVRNNDVQQVLENIRLRNINRVIFGHLNVNFFALKLDAIKTIIPGNVDIMIFGETKLDASYPTAQLIIDGFKTPYTLDQNSNGGGLLIYVRTDIPCKQLVSHEFAENIEEIFWKSTFEYQGGFY